jgi:L-asparaginase II
MNAAKLVDVYRGGKIESSHYGHIAVVDSTGKLLYSAGDPNRLTYARSAVKPIQAIPLVESGAAEKYNLSNADLSLCCGSHCGESNHTDQVLSMLQKADLEENALQCGTHIPFSQNTYISLLKAQQDPTVRHHNCSGKHSGMLLTAKHLHESLADYYLPDHPVQKRILETMSDVCDYPEEKITIGIDGCGVPVFEMPLYNLAFGFARMARPETLGQKRGDVVERITKAMMKHPEMVGGTGRFCTDFMNVAQGTMFGKLGAESVYCLGDRESGLGIAVKIEDGSVRAIYPATLEVLKQLNLITQNQLEELMDHYRPILKNARNEEVGYIEADFQLKEK